jgi:hypothetical protein
VERAALGAHREINARGARGLPKISDKYWPPWTLSCSSKGELCIAAGARRAQSGRPDSKARRVARSRSSSLYFFGAAMRREPFLSARTEPGFEVSVKPSPPHQAERIKSV